MHNNINISAKFIIFILIFKNIVLNNNYKICNNKMELTIIKYSKIIKKFKLIINGKKI
jgi:hypothetical protein